MARGFQRLIRAICVKHTNYLFTPCVSISDTHAEHVSSLCGCFPSSWQYLGSILHLLFALKLPLESPRGRNTNIHNTTTGYWSAVNGMTKSKQTERNAKLWFPAAFVTFALSMTFSFHPNRILSKASLFDRHWITWSCFNSSGGVLCNPDTRLRQHLPPHVDPFLWFLHRCNLSSLPNYSIGRPKRLQTSPLSFPDVVARFHLRADHKALRKPLSGRKTIRCWIGCENN